MAELDATRDRASVLAVARVGEQLALAAALVVLARRLPVRDFGTVSLVFALQSLAVTASDYGLGLALLRTPPGQLIEQLTLRRCRRRNLAVSVLLGAAGALVALAGDGVAGLMIGLAGLLWAASAEAYVRKAAALRLGAVRSVALSELGASGLLLVLVVLAADGSRAAPVVAGAFVAKSVVEAIAQPTVLQRSFSAGGTDPNPGWVWGSQVLAFASANVDYVVVQALLGSRALGLYSLAFRIVGLVPSQVAFVVSRVFTLDLARRPSDERSETARRLVRVLFTTGLVIAAGGMAMTPLLGDTLGHKWDDAEPLMALLLLAVPWRLVLPVSGISALVRDEARELCGFEVLRLAFVVSMLVVGAHLGLVWCAAFAAGSVVLGSVWSHTRTPFRPTDPPPGWLGLTAGLFVGLLVGGAALLA